jgi:CHAD domain-containing protein
MMSHQRSLERAAGQQRGASARESSPGAPDSAPQIKPGDPVGNAVVSALQVAVARISASDREVRQGDGEGIHRLRIAIRRLRSELRALKAYVDQPWRDDVERELKWLAGLLGGARDLDILLARLRKSVASRERNDGAAFVLTPLFRALKARRARSARALDAALESDRYRRLLDTLKRAVEQPPLQDAARAPCGESLPPAAAAVWGRLKKAGRGLRLSDPGERFHEVRKRAKRARYTAEFVAPVLGRRGARGARRFIRRTTQIQDALGEHQDASVAAQEVERFMDCHAVGSDFAHAAENLIEAERKTAAAARADVFEILAKLDRKKSRRWMKIRPKAKAAAEL